VKVACDTNVMVYAFADFRDSRKTEIARTLVTGLADRNELVISTQVLKEFVNVATRKLKPSLPRQVIQYRLTAFADLEVIPVSLEIILAAVDTHFASIISFYDALHIESARTAGAEILYSEDTQHGRRYGSVQVINPFPIL
jgi:predicted nucleic acid-binding protein